MTSPLGAVYQRLTDALAPMTFAPPVAYVYNPLVYAAAPHAAYIARYGVVPHRVLFLGMNPGPFGMAQTGVPFGEVAFVRDWIGIEAPVARPAREHPKRPIEGFACTRSEVSGTRLWSFFRDTFGSADAFFARAFVANYCPLVFVEEGGANRTPDKLPRAERDALFRACDAALADVIRVLAPSRVVGVGAFAEAAAQRVVGSHGLGVPVGTILHPSPASPRANRGWANEARVGLEAQGLAWWPAT